MKLAIIIFLLLGNSSNGGQFPLFALDGIDIGQASMHQAELEFHKATQPALRIMPNSDLLEKAAKNRSLERVVYGYYPYWVQDLESINFDAITHLAWFAVELDSGGNAVSLHGWPDSISVEACHVAEVKVHLTFTIFDGEAIRDLVSNNADNAIVNMINLMESGDADGISVDFEGLISGTREPFTKFICSLRQQLDQRGHSDAQISIAGPAVDWSSQFDLDALLDCADWFFIMGYGYFWSGASVAGPIGMLKISPSWQEFQSRSMLRTLADYSKLIPAAKRRQLIHGVPYYGREWTTESGEPASQTTGHIGAVTYSSSMEDLDKGLERQYDAGVNNPWYSWIELNSWHQVWYDDEQSLAAKYSLALDQNLGGIGIWALNYDAPHKELWNLLKEKFSSQPPTPLGHRLNPITIEHFPFTDSRDTNQGPGCYFNYYNCDPDLPEYGREWVYEVDLCQSGSIVANVPQYPDRDPDLALLDAPTQDSCLARAHTDLTAHVSPGKYLLVVDTFVDGAIELSGPYELMVDFLPDTGSKPCSEYLICINGSCRCEDPSYTDCGFACVDTDQDVNNCGLCGKVCESMHTCDHGLCKEFSDEPDGGNNADAGGGDYADRGQNTATGCQCSSDRQTQHPAFFAFFLFIFLLSISKKTRWI